MKRSTERILTTHVGSIRRPPELRDLIRAREAGEPYDAEALDARLQEAVADVVRRQVEAGIDVVNDGEMGKSSFLYYVAERLTGVERRPLPPGPMRLSAQDEHAFPEYYRESRGFAGGAAGPRPVCAGPLAYKGMSLLEIELANLRAAVDEHGGRIAEAFVPSIGPGSLACSMANDYYRSEEEYVGAIAEAMKTEYRAIIAAGFIVQIDDPWLPAEFANIDPPISPEASRRRWEPRVEALNQGLSGLPEDRIRLHICWGSWHGPHAFDLPLREVLPLLFKAKVGAYSVEGANARHEHEYHVWEDVRLPEGKLLIPGIVAHATDHVEHPDFAAERLARYATRVGRENVIGGADCGFARAHAHPSVMWAKFRSLAAGARLASEALWR